MLHCYWVCWNDRRKGSGQVKKLWERWTCILVSFTLCIGFVPAQAFAAVGDTASSTGSSDEVAQIQEEPEGGSAEAVGQAAEDPVEGLQAAAPAEEQGDAAVEGDEAVAQQEPAAKVASAQEQTRGVESVEEGVEEGVEEDTETEPNVTTVDPMELGVSYYADLGENDYWVGVFTALQDGAYVFTSSDNSDDTYGTLYSDADLTDVLVSDDDSAGNRNFSVSYELSAGQTVYLKAEGFNGREASFVVSAAYIDIYNLSNGQLELNSEVYLWTGDPVEVIGWVYTAMGSSVSLNDDFEWVFWDADEQPISGAPSDLGTYFVSARGIGDYSGETTKQQFRIVDKNDISGGQWIIEGVSECEYTGNPIDLPEIQIYCYDEELGDVHLTADQEFQLAYWTDDEGNKLSGAPKNPGYYYAVLEGIGDYHGEARYGIEITDNEGLYASHNIGDESHFYNWLDKRYFQYGQPLELSNYVKICRWSDSDGWVPLVEGTDYELLYYKHEDGSQLTGEPTEIGKYIAVFSGKSPYVGTCELAFNIVDMADPDAPKDISDWYWNKNYTSTYEYTGSPVDVPDFEICHWNDEYSADIYLVRGVDYQITSYYSFETEQFLDSAPIEKGYYSALAQGIGEYEGEYEIRFQICDPYNIADGNYWYFSSDTFYTYTGEPIELDTIRFYRDSTDLVLNQDYRFVRYEDTNGKALDSAPVGPGWFAAVYEGIDPYYGTRKVSFSICDPYDIGSDFWYSYTDSDDNQIEYTGNPVVLSGIHIYRTDSESGQDINLEEDVDYKLSYYLDRRSNRLDEAPANPGWYRAVYTGISPYKGEFKRSFRIVGDDTDLTFAHFDLIKDTFSYTGEPVTIRGYSAYTSNENYIDRGAYEFVFFNSQGAEISAPTEPGDYKVAIRAIDGSGYKGTSSSVNFSILDQYDIRGYEGSYPNRTSNFAETGSPIVLPILYLNGAIDGVWTGLVQDKDFKLDHFETLDGETLSQAPSAKGEYFAVYKGLEPFFGYNRQYFKICDRYDFTSVSVDIESTYIPLVDGVAKAKFAVIDGLGTVLKEDEDYVLKYSRFVDGQGQVELDGPPTEPGSYDVQVCPVPDGPYYNEQQIYYGIEVYDKYGIDSEVWYPSLRNRESFSYTSASGNGRYIYSNETEEVARNLVFDISNYDSGKTIAENLDFKVENPIVDEALHAVTYVFTGIGNYHGTIRTVVYYAANAQESFEARRAYTYGFITGDSVATSNVVSVSADGTLVTPDVFIQGLIAGVDYKVDGFENADKAAITTANVGDTVYVKLKGLGAFDGCERRIAANVTDVSSAVGLDSGNVSFSLLNGVYTRSGNSTQWYLLKNATPSVSLVVYGRGMLHLENGTGFSVSQQLDGDTMNLTVSGIAGSPVSGSVTKSIKLVDQFDISTIFTSNSIFVIDSRGRGASNQGGKTNLKYYGVPFVPRIGFGNNGLTSQDYTLILKDEAGSVVPAITGEGKYTLVVQGVGNWTGKIDLPLEVAQESSSADLSDATMTITGDTTLSNGAAEPEVKLWYAGNPLEENVDYILDYGNNTEVGNRAWVKATPAQGSKFTGEKAINFTVTSQVKVLSALDYEMLLGTSGGIFRPARTLTAFSVGDDFSHMPSVLVNRISDGKNLKEGTDYEVVFAPISRTGLTYVQVVGIGDYTGTMSANFFAIGSKSLANVKIGSISDKTYTGSAFKPLPALYDGSTELVRNTDYTVTWENNVNAGTAKAIFTGKGSYSGTVEKTFTIKPKALANTDITIGSISAKVFSGSAFEPKPVLKYGDITLVRGTDYTATWTNNVNVGTATATFTGTGNYSFTVSKKFTIKAKPISEVTIGSISTKTYTGSAFKPLPALKNGDIKLVRNTDYTVTWTNNVNVGTATATFTGKGNYTGTKTKTFKINPKPISEVTIGSISAKTYTGSAFTPSPALKNGDVKLVKGTDYTVTWKNNVNAGTASAVFTGKGNYTGTATKTFKINPKPITDQEITIGSISAKTYSGAAFKPSPALKNGDVKLVKGTDYTVTWKNNVNAGTASAVFTGKGNYTGTKTKTFKINPKPITSVTIGSISTKTYTGSAFKPSPALTNGSTKLVKDTDYTVTWKNNVNAGTASAVFTGKGNYSGTATKTFTIKKSTTLKLAAQSKTYTGQALSYTGTRVPTGGTVTYTYYSDSACKNKLSSKPIKAGVYYVKGTVKADANHEAATSAAAKFTIKAKPITSVTIGSISDKTYTGSAFKPLPALKDGSTKLVRNTDYTVTWENNVNAGIGKVIFTGKGNYSGTVTKEFPIKKAAGALEVSSIAGVTCAPGAVLAADELFVVENNTSGGDVTYAQTSSNECVSVANDGTVTVAENAPAGSYEVVVTATSAATDNYESATAADVSFTITVE